MPTPFRIFRLSAAVVILSLFSGCKLNETNVKTLESVPAPGGKFEARITSETTGINVTASVEVENKESKKIERVFATQAIVKLVLTWRTEKDLDVCYEFKTVMSDPLGFTTQETGPNDAFQVRYYGLGKCPHLIFQQNFIGQK